MFVDEFVHLALKHTFNHLAFLRREWVLLQYGLFASLVSYHFFKFSF